MHRLAFCSLLFISVVNLSADDALRWPPELPGADNGTLALSSIELLRVPESVQKALDNPAAARFEVAKQPPAIDLAYHDNLGPDAASRRLWSSWGDICV